MERKECVYIYIYRMFNQINAWSDMITIHIIQRFADFPSLVFFFYAGLAFICAWIVRNLQEKNWRHNELIPIARPNPANAAKRIAKITFTWSCKEEERKLLERKQRGSAITDQLHGCVRNEFSFEQTSFCCRQRKLILRIT